MKKLIIILLSVFPFITQAQNVYYVQDTSENVNASDANVGTDINNPWASWQHAFVTADAGDTVYFRNGTWDIEDQITYDPEVSGNVGTSSDNPICFFNYPGENPIGDWSHRLDSVGGFVPMVITNADYVKFRGLQIQNAWQIVENSVITGWSIYDSEWISVDQCVATKISGAGFFFGGNDTLFLTNCDSYNNVDSTSEGSPGGRADGFMLSTGDAAVEDTLIITYAYGNRSWFNGDDGFDIPTTKQYQVYNNWSFFNGRLSGDGDGFKLAWSHVYDPEKREFYNNVSAYNGYYDPGGPYWRGNGFDWNNLWKSDYGPRQVFYNNLSYYDPIGVAESYAYFDCDTASRTIIRNNIVHSPREERTYIQLANFGACHGSNLVLDHNIFQLSGTLGYTEPNDTFNITDADFIGPLDSASIWDAMTASRQSDGSLPVMTNFNLAEGSDLIDAGVDVGLPYRGLAPDLGPNEYGTADTVDVTSITISAAGSATTIEVNNGTLQMSALVAPDTATFGDVTWSTHSGSGSGTITQGGLVQAVTNGTDTIRATAQDGTGIYDDYILTYSNQNEITIPTVITSATLGNSTYYITTGGDVTATGGASVTAKGICWSTSENPTTSDYCTIDGTGTGSYTTSLTFSIPGVTYYIRAYATNSEGTAYGDNRQARPLFTTHPVKIGASGKPRFKNGKPIMK
jgi:hypothetical protein